MNKETMQLLKTAMQARTVMGNARDFLYLEMWSNESEYWTAEHQWQELQKALLALDNAIKAIEGSKP